MLRLSYASKDAQFIVDGFMMEVKERDRDTGVNLWDNYNGTTYGR